MRRRVRHWAQSSTLAGSFAGLLGRRARIELLVAITDKQWGIQLGGVCVCEGRLEIVPVVPPLSSEAPGR